MGKSHENYGDLLSKYLVEKISGKKVEWVQPKKIPWYRLDKSNVLAAGSIIHHATKSSFVWGSGIIDHDQKVAKANFRAVRGPQTRQYLNDLGYHCPEVFGDPAILLPLYFKPKVEKKHRVGIVPHYHDFKAVSEQYPDNKDIKIIDLMTLDVENVTRQILECEKIISSSLHGLIVAHAYEIPAIWVKFSNKLFGNDIKFRDYFESVNIAYGESFLWKEIKSNEDIERKFTDRINLPSRNIIKKIQEDLLDTCPFVKIEK
ncbi:polysaccharide pyruvyl transferase family protein [Gramella sp. MT6]|nr:polysaccharide pyruvyl transferase family protein [Gramella sp. MT6]